MHPGCRDRRARWTRFIQPGLVLLCGLLAGCGTTRVTDTQRTATEQLLVSNAIDQAVSQLDFRLLAGKSVYFDPQYLDGTVDRGYLVSSLRQHLLANGCILQEERTKATYVIEARSGGIGTDRHALLFGVPQMNVPTLVPGQPSQIPEIPFAKKTDQKGIAKIAVFAYNRQTGRPAFQSGVVESTSTSKDTWVLGAGPFQRGSIRSGTEFAGQPLQIPFIADKPAEEPPSAVIGVTRAALWTEPPSRGEAAPVGGDSPTAPERLHAPQMIESPKSLLRVPSDLPSNPAKEGVPVAAIASPSSTTPAKSSPPTPNAGGQAETQPCRVISSGFGLKPDG